MYYFINKKVIYSLLPINSLFANFYIKAPAKKYKFSAGTGNY